MGTVARGLVAVMLGCTLASCTTTFEVGCTYTDEEPAVCDQYVVDEDEKDAAEASCRADSMTVFGRCPLERLDGCCVKERRGLTLYECFYVAPREITESYCAEHGWEYVEEP